MKRKETKREVELQAAVDSHQRLITALDETLGKLAQEHGNVCQRLFDMKRVIEAQGDVLRDQRLQLYAAGLMIAQRDLEIARLNKQIELQQVTLKGLEQYTWGKNTRVEQTITVSA